MIARTTLAFVLLSLAGCGEAVFTEPMTLGGKTVSPETLEEGRHVYRLYCRACHGDSGDGKGPAAYGLSPQPRDFTKGEFKFAAVPAGQLPNDEDLKRTIRGGLAGTAMLPWDISEPELDAVVQYIKTFRPVDEEGNLVENKWMKKDKTGEVIEISPDPWKGKEKEAIARGKSVYHVKAQCAKCHNYYATLEEVYEMSKAQNAEDGYTLIVRELRPDPFLPVIQESKAYGKILPPDFTFRAPRSGTSAEAIYRAIASGIGGTAMPKWKGALPEEDLWALTHYVKWLVDIRDTPEAAKLLSHLQSAPEFTPPPPEPAPGEEAPAEGGEGAAQPTGPGPL